MSELFALNHVKVSFLSHKGVWHLKVRCAWEWIEQELLLSVHDQII